MSCKRSKSSWGDSHSHSHFAWNKSSGANKMIHKARNKVTIDKCTSQVEMKRKCASKEIASRNVNWHYFTLLLSILIVQRRRGREIFFYRCVRGRDNVWMERKKVMTAVCVCSRCSRIDYDKGRARTQETFYKNNEIERERRLNKSNQLQHRLSEWIKFDNLLR